MLDIEWFRSKIKASDYELTSHANEERQAEMVSIEDLEKAVLAGEVIEDYESRKDSRGHSCLIYGPCEDESPLHVVVAKTPQGDMRVCTVYRPEEEKFKDGKKRRIK